MPSGRKRSSAGRVYPGRPPTALIEGKCVSFPDRDRFFITPAADVLPKGDRLETQVTRDELWESHCKSCPVLQECFDHAIKREEWGIWAGTTEWDRIRIRTEEGLEEFARNRLAAGYVPIPSKLCAWKGCVRQVVKTFCKVHGKIVKQRSFDRARLLSQQILPKDRSRFIDAYTRAERHRLTGGEKWWW